MAADITWSSTTTPNKNKNDQQHGQEEQEQEEEDYGVSEESCIFNCPYVEEQVNAEVTIESSRALAGGDYFYYTSNSIDRQNCCCSSSSSSSSGARASGEDARAGAATSIYGQEREQLLESRLEDAAEQEEEHQEEEEQECCAASSSSSTTILGHPGLGQGQRASTAVAVVREQQEHEVGSGCSRGASVTTPTTQTASVLLDTVAFGTRPSSSRQKTLSPEEVNFILKWKCLRAAANQKQTFRNMSSAAMSTSCSLPTVPEKEEVLELGNSASSSAGCHNHQQQDNHHHPAVIRGVVSPHDMLRSFPNVARQDTISLLDYDLSMSQDDETNVNNDDAGGANSSFQEDE